MYKETLNKEFIFEFHIMKLVEMINTTWSIIEPLLAESKPACRITNFNLAPNHFGSLLIAKKLAFNASKIW